MTSRWQMTDLIPYMYKPLGVASYFLNYEDRRIITCNSRNSSLDLCTEVTKALFWCTHFAWKFHSWKWMPQSSKTIVWKNKSLPISKWWTLPRSLLALLIFSIVSRGWVPTWQWSQFGRPLACGSPTHWSDDDSIRVHTSNGILGGSFIVLHMMSWVHSESLSMWLLYKVRCISDENTA